ncbi:hypothetical protein [Bradyrhizobium sp. WSM1743]|uniref:hypothetical protein n=1 Tax=Bradyrhizobium sp. WSM1743 TaxID=318996 RepID=UPI001FDA3DD2|nr:hypothetical protein [Bradyrhizobium sp. WSM1743]
MDERILPDCVGHSHRNKCRTLAFPKDRKDEKIRPRAGASFRDAVCSAKNRGGMKIRTHVESHVVELDDGSQWKIFPGDLATTLSWKPETDLRLEQSGERMSSHVLVNTADQSRVRVIAADETWPDGEVKNALKDG